MFLWEERLLTFYCISLYLNKNFIATFFFLCIRVTRRHTEQLLQFFRDFYKREKEKNKQQRKEIRLH